MTEMREAFAVFAPVPRRPEGDRVRLGPHPARRPAVRPGRRDIAAALAARGWMVVTGAGPGIMQAAMEGAGREHSIGVAIRLPFEQGANPVIAGDEKYVSDEVLLHPQADAGQGERGRSSACPAGSARSTRRSSCSP